jgi:hypothetical protein
MGARTFRRCASSYRPYHELLPLEKNDLEVFMTLSERAIPQQFLFSQNYIGSEDCGILAVSGVCKPSLLHLVSHARHDFSHALNADFNSSMRRFGERVYSIKIKTERSYASGVRSHEKKIENQQMCRLRQFTNLKKHICRIEYTKLLRSTKRLLSMADVVFVSAEHPAQNKDCNCCMEISADSSCASPNAHF